MAEGNSYDLLSDAEDLKTHSLQDELIDGALLQPDTKEDLLFINKNNHYHGYKKEILAEEVNQITDNMITCVRCEGIIRGPCGVGNPLVVTCAACCVGEHHLPLDQMFQCILMLNVKCPISLRPEPYQRCDWEGKLDEVQAHVDECDMFIRTCDLFCGRAMQRNEFQAHIEYDCVMRIVECDYCSETFTYIETETHNNICELYPIECTNDKCDQSIPRNEFSNHLENCDFTEVDCEYVEYGCNHRIQKKDILGHNEMHSLTHMQLEIKHMKDKIMKLEVETNRFDALAGYNLSLNWFLDMQSSHDEHYGPSFKVPSSSTVFYPIYSIEDDILHISLRFKTIKNLSFRFWVIIINQKDLSFCTLNKQSILSMNENKTFALIAGKYEFQIAQFGLTELRDQDIILNNTTRIHIYSLRNFK